MLDYRTPGVYIEELPARGPIAGVGTSVAAFIGAASDGPVGVPVRVTNWTQFADNFGEYIVSPPQQYFLAYAVRSFFENGGTLCWVVRAGNAAPASKDLLDRSGQANSFALHVQSKLDGTGGNGTGVIVTDEQIVTNASIVKARAQGKVSQAKDVLTLGQIADAALFAVGDWVTIEGSNPPERVRIRQISNDELRFETPLVGTYSPTTSFWVRIADVDNQKSFRVKNGGSLEPGSAIHLTDSATPTPTEENAVVAAVRDDWITLDRAVTRVYKLGSADPTVTVTSFEFGLKFTKTGWPDEEFKPLAMDPRHSRFWAGIVSANLVTVSRPAQPGLGRSPDDRPAAPTTTTLNPGTADTLPPSLTNYRTALDALQRIDDVNLVACPDPVGLKPTFQNLVVQHCETMGDRFAILDSDRGEEPNPPPPKPSVLAHRAQLSSKRGYGALYYPWLWILDPASPRGDVEVMIPPSGAIAGIFARSDATVGVHKAPANEEIRNAVRLEAVLTDAEQGDLNVEGVNVIRAFPGIGRPVVWGARTIAPTAETAWRYVNVRRLFLYIEESLQQGLQPWVFDPNDLGLWKKLNRTVTEFLTRVWRSGALFGATAADAFYVKIDEENNPESVRALGQVVIEIGLAPVRPAEFIVVRIGMWAGKSEIQESGG
jgi:phage tail sheath protein FI